MGFLDVLNEYGLVLGSIILILAGIVSIGIWVWKKRFEKRMEVNKKYDTKQFEIRSDLWSKLVEIKYLFNSLWERVTQEEILKLSNSLEEVKIYIDKSSIFLKPEHITELHEIIKVIGNFESGKTVLLDLRNSGDNPYIDIQGINQQIGINRELKDRYIKIIDEVREDFRNDYRRTG